MKSSNRVKNLPADSISPSEWERAMPLRIVRALIVLALMVAPSVGGTACAAGNGNSDQLVAQIIQADRRQRQGISRRGTRSRCGRPRGARPSRNSSPLNSRSSVADGQIALLDALADRGDRGGPLRCAGIARVESRRERSRSRRWVRWAGSAEPDDLPLAHQGCLRTARNSNEWRPDEA